MAKVKTDVRELKKWAESIQTLADEQANEFLRECAALLAGEFIKMVKPRTPVGEYPAEIKFTANPSEPTKEVHFQTKDGREVFFTAKNQPKEVSFKNPVEGMQGGTLRNGWTVESIEKVKGGYEATIVNSVDYASHVEYGHRIMNKKGGAVKGWKRGKFMMTDTEIEMAFVSKEILTEKLEDFLKQVF